MPLSRSKGGVAYLVRSFRTNARIRSLTTGTFNRVVKDRIAIRLSGAHSVQFGNTQVRFRLSSKPYKHTVRRKTLSTPASHRISTPFPHGKEVAGRGDGELKARKPRATVWPSALKERSFSAQPKAEDRKLRKELALEVLALKVPFRNCDPFGNQASESSPVAGTIEDACTLLTLRCRTRTRVAENAPSQPHKCSRCIVYTRGRRDCATKSLRRAGVYQFGSSMRWVWQRCSRVSFAPRGLFPVLRQQLNFTRVRLSTAFLAAQETEIDQGGEDQHENHAEDLPRIAGLGGEGIVPDGPVKLGKARISVH